MTKTKHRKLLPMLASETNKNLDCSIGICDTTCPYNCYQEPPQPSTAPFPAISAVYNDSEKPSSSDDAITITTITGAVLLILLSGFCLAAKFSSDSVNRVDHERYQSEDTVEEEFQDREQMDHHPIWLIRTTGLQQSIINSIKICSYKRGDGLIERTDCPVCLNEFEEDESLRLLPKCNHAFHISCIDTWLRSHTNCPLCRAGISISAGSSRSSCPVVVTPGEPGSRSENDGVAENRVELGRETDDESGFKERLSSRYRNSDNPDPKLDVRVEINRNLEEIDGDRSKTETEEQVRVLGEKDSIYTLSNIESLNFPGKSCENQSQDYSSKENRTIGDEASCSEENGGQNIQLQISSDSIASGETNGEAIEDSGLSSKTTGSSSSISCFSKNTKV